MAKIGIPFYEKGSSIDAFWLLAGFNGALLILYFFFASRLYSKSIKERELNYKVNVIDRKRSIAEKYESVLDESEIPASEAVL